MSGCGLLNEARELSLGFGFFRVGGVATEGHLFGIVKFIILIFFELLVHVSLKGKATYTN